MRIHHATVAKAKKFQITLTVGDNEVVATSKTGTRLASGLQGNKVLEEAITKATGKAAKAGSLSKAMAPAAKPARKPRAKKAVEQDEDEGADEALEIEAEDESEADQSKSIVKAAYKKKYAPTGNRCGDDLSIQVNKHVSAENSSGEIQVDKKALKRFAEANGVWSPAYGSFVSRTGSWNSGMAIMCINNKLRAKVRQAVKREEKFEIQWV